MQITQKQLGLAKILQELKIVQHDGMDLCRNFQKDLLKIKWVMGPGIEFFPEFYISNFDYLLLLNYWMDWNKTLHECYIEHD